jgi:hypothetical protein
LPEVLRHHQVVKCQLQGSNPCLTASFRSSENWLARQAFWHCPGLSTNPQLVVLRNWLVMRDPL